MASSFFRDAPPYSGDEPYVYLCFHEADARQVKPFLDELLLRRCRVWYSMGLALKSDANRARTYRAANASLMIFWLSAHAADDERMKSSLGHYQASGRPIICIDTQDNTAQSGFSLILSGRVNRVSLTPGGTMESLVSNLMRMDGFSQQLIAENDHERQRFLSKRKARRIALIILAAALVVLGGAIVYAQSNDWFRPQAEIVDSVIIEDAVIARAARFALAADGKAALTQESLARIQVLHLDAAPVSFDELALFPALTRLEIPQSCVEQASALLETAEYTIVVYPEAGE